MNTEEILAGLNDEQRLAATTIDGAVRLVAGAGSGKTHTLTRRVAYICASRNIHPSRVLSLTFTNKAAAEMRSRTAKLLDRAESDFYMSTFHSLALDIVKKDCDTVFGWKDFKIAQLTGGMLVPMFFKKNSLLLDGLDEVTKQEIKEYLLEKVNRALNSPNYPKWLDASYDLPILATRTDFIDAMQKDVASSKAYQSIKQKIKKETDSYKIEDLCKEYEDCRVSSSVLDPVNTWVKGVIAQKKGICCFDDLINCALYMLENYPNILEYWSNQFDYIQVDEFQDTDSKQLRIVQLLYQRHGNLFVVGDPDQSIYIFRGAEPSLFNRLDDYIPNLKTIFMITNYRSTSEIVDVSNEVIKLNQNRIEKTCESKKGDGSKVKVLIGDMNTPLEVLEYNEIKKLLNNDVNVNVNDIAVLYRSVKDETTYKLQEMLKLNNIPIVTTLVFKDIYEEATLNICKYNYSKETAFLVSAAECFVDGNDLHSKKLVDLNKFVVPSLDVDTIFSLFESLKRRYMKNRKVPTPVKDYQTFLDKSTEIRQSIERVLNDWKRLSNFEKQKKCVVNLLDDSVEVEEGDGIKIMTMHKSKGLEFPYVFVNSLTKTLLDKSMDSAEEHEEKARLAYVAYSRAKEQLYLGCENTSDIHGVLGQVSNMPNVECVDRSKLQDFQSAQSDSLKAYNDVLDNRTKVVYYRVMFNDKIYGYRCVLSLNGEQVAYQAKIEDLERLNCVPKERIFLVTVSRKDIILHEMSDGRKLSNDEINATMRVKALVKDNDILSVFKGSNNGFEKDIKDMDTLADLIKDVKKEKSPFEKYLDILAKRQQESKKFEASKEIKEECPKEKSVENVEDKAQKKVYAFALIINQNDNRVIGVRVIKDKKFKDITVEEAKSRGITPQMCKQKVYKDEKITVPYIVFINTNKGNKDMGVMQGRLEIVDLPLGVCVFRDLATNTVRDVKIGQIVQMVLNSQIYLKNPSSLTQWKNWSE